MMKTKTKLKREIENDWKQNEKIENENTKTAKLVTLRKC